MASAITPVPGGVGPVTVAALLRSAAQAAKNQLGPRRLKPERQGCMGALAGSGVPLAACPPVRVPGAMPTLAWACGPRARPPGLRIRAASASDRSNIAQSRNPANVRCILMHLSACKQQAEGLPESSRWQSAAPPPDCCNIEQGDPEGVVYRLDVHATLSGLNGHWGTRVPWAARRSAHGYCLSAFQAEECRHPVH